MSPLIKHFLSHQNFSLSFCVGSVVSVSQLVYINCTITQDWWHPLFNASELPFKKFAIRQCPHYLLITFSCWTVPAVTHARDTLLSFLYDPYGYNSTILSGMSFVLLSHPLHHNIWNRLFNRPRPRKKQITPKECQVWWEWRRNDVWEHSFGPRARSSRSRLPDPIRPWRPRRPKHQLIVSEGHRLPFSCKMHPCRVVFHCRHCLPCKVKPQRYHLHLHRHRPLPTQNRTKQPQHNSSSPSSSVTPTVMLTNAHWCNAQFCSPWLCACPVIWWTKSLRFWNCTFIAFRSW